MHHERVYQIVVEEDDITWQSLLLDLVKSGEMNPWDIDITQLSQKYIHRIRELHDMNLFVSGKMIVAASLLLRIKSEKLLYEGIAILDTIMFPPDELDDDFVSHGQERLILDVEPRLTVRTPQARKKKVSITDLIVALDRAMTVNERRVIRRERREYVPESLVIPAKPLNIIALIQELYERIQNFFVHKQNILFEDLTGPQPSKDVMFTTLVPLLYLATQSKIMLDQEEPFGTISIGRVTLK